MNTYRTGARRLSKKERKELVAEFTAAIRNKLNTALKEGRSVQLSVDTPITEVDEIMGSLGIRPAQTPTGEVTITLHISAERYEFTET